jgi:hypothetical protein
VREDGLSQVEVAELLGRHKSWTHCSRHVGDFKGVSGWGWGSFLRPGKFSSPCRSIYAGLARRAVQLDAALRRRPGSLPSVDRSRSQGPSHSRMPSLNDRRRSMPVDHLFSRCVRRRYQLVVGRGGHERSRMRRNGRHCSDRHKQAVCRCGPRSRANTGR